MEKAINTDSLDTWRNVDAFNNSFLTPSDPALEAALQRSYLNEMPTKISVTTAQGKFLSLIIKSIGAKRVLEIGTLAAYSTIWMARALPDDGEVVTLEVDPKHAEVAKENLIHANVMDKVKIVIGAAFKTLESMTEMQGLQPFDFVFVDADAEGVASYFAHAKKLVRPGGVIIVDNVIRWATVADLSNPDEGNKSIRTMLAALKEDSDVEATIIGTVGAKDYDGFLYAVRLR